MPLLQPDRLDIAASDGWGSAASWLERVRAGVLPLVTLGIIIAGAILLIGSATDFRANVVWWLGLAVVGGRVVTKTARELTSGRFALDLVASLAIVFALLLWEPLAGLVIVMMQTGGEALERYAERRASEAVRALEEAAPRIAHRLTEQHAIEDVAAGEIATGELILVRPGELIPCDSVVLEGRSHVDASRLTGEPMAVTAEPGVRLMSGSINLDGPLRLRVLAPSAESQYEKIVQLVRSAQASKAPMQRLADRYGIWFTPAVLVICLAAYLLSGDPVRILAVLVVATPCPLLLATPVAIIGGINAAARRQIIVRNGTALEQLGRLTVAVFDKTGTVTVGKPRVRRVIPCGGWTEDAVLRFAGAVEGGSGHLLAHALTDEAGLRLGALPPAQSVQEAAGRGVTGIVEGHRVAVGARGFVIDRHHRVEREIDALADSGKGLRAYVAVDGRLAGIVEYADAIRPELPRLLSTLADLGLRQSVLLSGDQSANVQEVARQLGITDATGELLPEDKVEVIRRLQSAGEQVLMIGDGTNDAPALTSADIGVALASHGGGITAEAADVVILSDDLTRVGEAIEISRWTVRIARQCIWIGLSLSGIAVGFAAFGHIVPVIGALLQEGIDLAVIVNALRASRPPFRQPASSGGRQVKFAGQLPAQSSW